MLHVYITNVSDLPDPLECPEMMERLTENRKQKIIKYRQLKDRKQCLGAGILLLKVLNEYGKNPSEIYYDENGKPELEGICFNISHSHEMVACAVSDKPIGIDIEKIEDIREDIAGRFFTDHENKYLEMFIGQERTQEFFRLWTMKESYMKYTGEGMRLALNRFEFLMENGVKLYRDGKLCNCYIKEYDIPGYKLTVCSEEECFINEIEYVDMR